MAPTLTIMGHCSHHSSLHPSFIVPAITHLTHHPSFQPSFIIESNTTFKRTFSKSAMSTTGTKTQHYTYVQEHIDKSNPTADAVMDQVSIVSQRAQPCPPRRKGADTFFIVIKIIQRALERAGRRVDLIIAQEVKRLLSSPLVPRHDANAGCQLAG